MTEHVEAAVDRLGHACRPWHMTHECGARFTREQWLARPFVGIQEGFKGVPAIELRDCTCGSTLGRPVEGTP